MAQTWQAWRFPDGDHDVESMVGWTVQARDGAVGTVDDASLDAGEGALVVGTGRVLFGHMALLPAGTVGRVDPDHRCLYVALTREEIEGAPRRGAGTRFADEDYRTQVAEYYGALSGRT